MSAAPCPFHTFFDNTKARQRLHLAHSQNMLVADHSSNVYIPSHFPVFLLLVFSIIWMLHGQLVPLVPPPQFIHPDLGQLRVMAFLELGSATFHHFTLNLFFKSRRGKKILLLPQQQQDAM
jgi:hypothetical protein